MTFSPFEFVPCRRGDKGEHVARLQGWLALHGYDPGPVDGDFGPRTEAALGSYQWQRHGTIIVDNSLTEVAWRSLTAPLARAMAPLEKWRAPSGALGQTAENMPRAPSLGEAVAAVARQWLAQQVGGGPLRELPGNSGPVVEACTRELAERDRLPCECGHGAEMHARALESECWASNCTCAIYKANWRLAWCAGWVSTVLRQACESLGADMPIRGSLSCDELARQAQKAGHYLPGGYNCRVDLIKPGDLFLLRCDKAGDWTHCGVVLEARWEEQVGTGARMLLLTTAEGNTNKDGSRNGTELRERVRSLDGLDFICWRCA